MKLRFGFGAGLLGVAMACGFLVLAGCELPGKGESSNRYEQLNIETKKLIEVLEQISDEKSAKAHEAELVAAADGVRAVQKRIKEAEEKRAKAGSSGGMGAITNARQASLFQQVGDSARRNAERIREEDMNAGVIVDKAMDGIELPPPPANVSSDI